MCTIALQPPSGPKLQGTFPYQTPLWDVLYQLQPSLLTTYTVKNKNHVLKLSDVMQTDAIPSNATWVVPLLVAIRIRIDSLDALTRTPIGKLGTRVLLHVSQIPSSLPFLPVIQVLQRSPLQSITALRQPSVPAVEPLAATAPPADSLDVSSLSPPPTSPTSPTPTQFYSSMTHITML